MKYTHIQILKLAKLLFYSNRYEINIQFWPDQTAVYISKDDVELQNYGGDFDFAIQSSLDYLKRINKSTNENKNRN